jgi:hypothetical protein
MTEKRPAGGKGKTRVTLWLTDATAAKLRQRSAITNKTQVQIVEDALDAAFAASRLDDLETRLARLEAERQPPLEESEDERDDLHP